MRASKHRQERQSSEIKTPRAYGTLAIVNWKSAPLTTQPLPINRNASYTQLTPVSVLSDRVPDRLPYNLVPTIFGIFPTVLLPPRNFCNSHRIPPKPFIILPSRLAPIPRRAVRSAPSAATFFLHLCGTYTPHCAPVHPFSTCFHEICVILDRI